MLRFPVAGMLLASLISAQTASAQQAEDPWQKLFTQGMYFAGAKDYARAEQNLLGAVREAERFGPDDVRVGSTGNTLGLVYLGENKFADAERAFQRSLPIMEKVYGVSSIDVANVHFNLATAMIDQGHQAPAMPHLMKAQATYEMLLGGASVKTGSVLCLEGDAYRAMKDYIAAEGPLRRCADIRESDGGMQNPQLADALYSLAQAYVGQGKYALAEARFKLAEKIRESTLGLTSPLVAETMEEHAALLKSMGRTREADKLMVLASAIRRNQKKGK